MSDQWTGERGRCEGIDGSKRRTRTAVNYSVEPKLTRWGDRLASLLARDVNDANRVTRRIDFQVTREAPYAEMGKRSDRLDHLEDVQKHEWNCHSSTRYLPALLEGPEHCILKEAVCDSVCHPAWRRTKSVCFSARLKRRKQMKTKNSKRSNCHLHEWIQKTEQGDHK